MNVRTYIYSTVFLLTVAAASFYFGTLFGIYQGANLHAWSNGLLRAETARRNLAALDANRVENVREMIQLELVGGLADHYSFMNYQYKYLVPAGTNYIMMKGYDKTFVARIQAYIDLHPNILTTSLYASQLPDANQQDRIKKEIALENERNFNSRIAWVLAHYRGGDAPSQPK